MGPVIQPTVDAAATLGAGAGKMLGATPSAVVLAGSALGLVRPCRMDGMRPIGRCRTGSLGRFGIVRLGVVDCVDGPALDVVHRSAAAGAITVNDETTVAVVALATILTASRGGEGMAPSGNHTMSANYLDVACDDSDGSDKLSVRATVDSGPVPCRDLFVSVPPIGGQNSTTSSPEWPLPFTHNPGAGIG